MKKDKEINCKANKIAKVWLFDENDIKYSKDGYCTIKRKYGKFKREAIVFYRDENKTKLNEII